MGTAGSRCFVGNIGHRFVSYYTEKENAGIRNYFCEAKKLRLHKFFTKKIALIY